MSEYQKIIKLANVWRLMKRRCEEPRAHNYHRYGGRGIAICPEWQDQDTFIKWALSSGYEIGLELDRRDNDGPYAPWNCQWLTHKENMQNLSTTRILTAWGEAKPFQTWVDDPRCRADLATVRKRIDHYGWSPEDALSVPPRGRPRADKGIGRTPITAFGEVKTLLDWVQDSRCQTTYSGLKQRIAAGWPADRAVTTPPRRRQHDNSV